MAGEGYKTFGFGLCGGGLVESINNDGGFAAGIEGSDYPKRHNLHAWARIPDKLFTADITESFTIMAGDKVLKFNVITAWEVLEHVKEGDLEKVMQSIDNHLDKNGIIIFSITPREEIIDGVRLHQNLNPRWWWIKRFKELGFVDQKNVKKYFGKDFIRGESYISEPHSFNLILIREKEGLPNLKKLMLLSIISTLAMPIEIFVFETIRFIKKCLPESLKQFIKSKIFKI